MVLYNEHNPNDEAIGAVVKADLINRPDALIVVGTSLKIPGAKRIVREMCGVVRGREDGMTIWINNDPPPFVKDLEWDLVVEGPCDEVARRACMRSTRAGYGRIRAKSGGNHEAGGSDNVAVYLPRPKEEHSTDAETLLSLVTRMERPVQVILDVGAQILELTNIQVARTWLEMLPTRHRKEAVVFFNEHDDLCVVDRKGHTEHLQTSPYSRQLDVCVVFLDEAHTRGTDLKLPEHYRAAVTLGANLTRDKLVQGK
jgi:hypothetical protein